MIPHIIMISCPDCHTHRSNTPIIYRAFPVWNVRVSHLVDDLVKNNGETRWFVTLLIHKCLNSHELTLPHAGCPRTLVRIDSETGLRTHATGLSLGIVIGAPRSRCGSRTTLKKYSPYSPIMRTGVHLMYRLSPLAPSVNSRNYRVYAESRTCTQTRSITSPSPQNKAKES